MATITFGSTTIIDSAEGGWQEPKIGMINPGYQFEKLANTDGELAKPVASGGCQHELTVNFTNVALANVSTIHNRMKALKTKGVQTLTIPEFPTLPNCVVESVALETKRTGNYSSGIGTLSITPAKNMNYTITFRQLFE